jgi:sulfite exporter TauE/SafE
MTILITAFLLGLMGSFHCVGMCGPIALSLPLRGETAVKRMWGSSLWSLGRMVTYAIFGALFGLIGAGFKLLGYQQIISITVGSLMILSVFLPALFKKCNFSGLLSVFNPIRRGMQRLLKEKNKQALFLIGIFNGLLPCGLVYLAVAGAIGTADVFSAIMYMVLFGLGTFPMLLVISLLGNVIGQTVRKQINQVVPIVIILIGIVFIMRGLSLGIPYLSPPKEKLSPALQIGAEGTSVGKAVENACCQKETPKTE